MLNFYVDNKKCVKCKQCVKDCLLNIISFGKKLPFIPEAKKDACIKCQHCLAVCPTGALSILNINPAKSVSLKNKLPEYEKLENLAKGRRSIRQYKDGNIDIEQINRLLTAALHAPTAINNMKVLFTVIDDKEVMGKYRNEIYKGIQRAVDKEEISPEMEFFSSIADKWFQEKNDIIFRQAPHMLIASAPKECSSPEVNAVIALSYFDLLAAAMGVGTLWCGMAARAIENIVPEMLTKLRIPKDHKIGYVMVFGKPSVKYYRTVQREPVNIQRMK